LRFRGFELANASSLGGSGNDCHHFGRLISRSASSRHRRVAVFATNTLPFSSQTRTRLFVGAQFFYRFPGRKYAVTETLASVGVL
jgi:hypothetical protein